MNSYPLTIITPPSLRQVNGGYDHNTEMGISRATAQQLIIFVLVLLILCIVLLDVYSIDIVLMAISKRSQV
jgi:hypothetical protein